jgi:hypothetical protein
MTGATDSGILPGQLVAILLLATAFTLPVSMGLLRLYRRAVLRSMRARADSREIESPETFAPPNGPTQTAPDLVVLDHASSIAVGPAAEGIYSRLRRDPWRAAAIYAVAGFCFAAVMAAAFLIPIGFSPFRYLSIFWTFAWPVVLTVNLVAAATWRARLATASFYFLVFAVLGAITLIRSPDSSWGQLIALWLIINLPATVLLLVFLNRRIRAVGPLVLAFMTLAVAGSQLVLSIVGSDLGLLRSITGLGLSIGLRAGGIFIGLMVLGFIAFGLAGWLTLRWIGHRYERKNISDQSITLDAIWLFLGVAQSISLLIFEGVAWILSGLLAFVIYKIVVRGGFTLLNREVSTGENPRLLLLRVFSLGRRSERLFDALAKSWRHVGSIRLIAGPDLATTTVEPHEFLDFLGGKLARRFIDGPKALDLRISEADLEPDRDGRFRVNDFFCHDDTWRMVLSRLVSESDAVLMDLRGFSPQNRGVAFEINEVVNVVPLERVVFVVDDTTDERFLEQTVQESWDQMRPTSPNRASTSGGLRLFRFTGSRGGELRRLLRAMCGAALAAPPTVATKG